MESVICVHRNFLHHFIHQEPSSPSKITTQIRTTATDCYCISLTSLDNEHKILVIKVQQNSHGACQQSSVAVHLSSLGILMVIFITPTHDNSRQLIIPAPNKSSHKTVKQAEGEQNGKALLTSPEEPPFFQMLPRSDARSSSSSEQLSTSSDRYRSFSFPPSLYHSTHWSTFINHISIRCSLQSKTSEL